jgi:predicted metalloprotease with PDZ domain
VVELADRARHKQSHAVGDWVELITREVGPQAKAEYEDMVAGVRLVPPANAFAPCFRPEPFEARLNDLGFDEGSLQGAHKVIRGLRPGSTAATAGLRNGDEVLRRSASDQDDPNHEITLTIRRDGAEQEIKFVPEGQSVPAYRWVRVTGIADGDCRY